MQHFPHPSFGNYRGHVAAPHKQQQQQQQQKQGKKRFSRGLDGRFYANNGLGQPEHLAKLEAARRRAHARRTAVVDRLVKRDLEEVQELERRVRSRQQRAVWGALVATSAAIVQTWWRGRAGCLRAARQRRLIALARLFRGLMP